MPLCWIPKSCTASDPKTAIVEISGETLDQRLQTHGAWSETEIWELLRDILQILRYLHRHQIVHQAIQPKLLIYSPNYVYGLLSSVVNNPLESIPLTNPEYAAPEQLQDNPCEASDLYGLGVTCIHLLTQCAPFDLYDDAEKCWAWRDFLLNPVSQDLGNVLDRLIAPKLDDRFKSADEALQALRITGITVPPEKMPPADWVCTQRLTGHRSSIQAIALSPDEQQLASGDTAGVVRLWNVATGDRLAALDSIQSAITGIAFLKDGEFLAMTDENGWITVWNVETQTIVQRWQGHPQVITAVASIAHRSILVTASWDKTIKLWNPVTESAIATFSGHTLAITSLAVHPNETLLASGSCDRTIKLWHLDTGKCLHTLISHTGPVTALAFSPDGKTLATGSDDRTIKLWDVATGNLLKTLPGHAWSIAALAFHPTQPLLISGSQNPSLKVWNLAQDTVGILPDHAEFVHALAIPRSGTCFISGSRDRTVGIWQPRSPEVENSLRKPIIS